MPARQRIDFTQRELHALDFLLDAARDRVVIPFEDDRLAVLRVIDKVARAKDAIDDKTKGPTA